MIKDYMGFHLKETRVLKLLKRGRKYKKRTRSILHRNRAIFILCVTGNQVMLVLSLLLLTSM